MTGVQTCALPILFGWRLWARLKIHENENVRDIGAYNRLMIDYTTNHQLPAIPGPIAARENRS